MPEEVPAEPLRSGADKLGLLTRAAALALVTIALAASWACSSSPKPDRLSPQTMSSSPPPQAEESDAADAREPIASAEADPTGDDGRAETAAEGRRSLTVVIEDKAADGGRARTLVEAAAAERERRAQAGRSIAVITNETLADYSDGQLTVMGESGTEGTSKPARRSENADSGQAPADPTTAEAMERDPESYWRERILEARRSWADAEAEIVKLEREIAELRSRFYAEDDPYYRDSQIKPEWDRALDRMGEVRRESEAHRIAVGRILDEGRRASALPGWLREGIELEPRAAAEDSGRAPRPGEYLPGEPKVATDPDDGSD